MSITQKELNVIINNKMIGLDGNDNDFEYNYTLCALIDQYYHFDDTCSEYNIRLRNSIKNNFNKILLTDDMNTAFRQWEENISSLSMLSTRETIYAHASMQSLHVIGL